MLVMYHVSVSDNRASIETHGLLASLDGTGLGAVFLTDVLPESIEGFDIWKVDAVALALEEDFTGEPAVGQWWMSYDDIPPNLIHLS